MERYRTLWERYGGVMERYGSVAYRYGMSQNVTKRYKALLIITERCGSVTEFLRNVTEPLEKISILLITNWILKFAHL